MSVAVEAAGYQRDVDEEVRLYHHKPGPQPTLVQAHVEQVQLHALAQVHVAGHPLRCVLLIAFLHDDAPLLCIGIDEFIVDPRHDAAQAAIVRVMGLPCRRRGLWRRDSCRHRHAEDGRDEQAKGVQVGHERCLLRHLVAVGVAAHGLDSHAVGHADAVALAQEVYLREHIAKALACRPRALGTRQHQQLVHPSGCSLRRFFRRQLPAKLKQLACFHDSLYSFRCCKVTNNL